MADNQVGGLFNAAFTYTDEVLSDFEALYLQKKEISPALRVALGVLGAAGDGLDVKIIRVGNLMGRQSDGEFQINSITNSFVKSLRAYAALGYVVYVVALPSGATGNGQAWSARHVNTAGDGPAQDIIEGTEQFCRGAGMALAVCREAGCTLAVLKARSPSCGRGEIYDGSFTHTRIPGNGVFADLLLSEGIQVLTEAEAKPEAL